MPSPDISPYVDLTLFDQASQSVFQNALDYARTALPEFQPQEGTIETVLLQAMALEVNDAITAINRVPNAIVEVLLRLLDVQRSSGARATSVMRFNGFTSQSFFVPSGTRLFYQADENSPPIVVETVTSVTGTATKQISTISQSSTTITVVTATPHGLTTGDTVSITGTGVTQLNVTGATVTVIDDSTFTVTSTSGTYSAATGTVTPSGTVVATAFVAVQTALLTADFNGTASGTAFTMLSVIPQVASATLNQSLLGGQSAETDDEYFTRATTTLRRITTGLNTVDQVENFILEPNRIPSVYRATVIDNTANTRSTSSGAFLVVAAPIDSSSTNLLDGVGDGITLITNPSYGTKDEIYDAVIERIAATTSFAVVDPSFVKVAVSATVKMPAGLDSSTVSSTATDVLNAYLSTNTWDWSTTLRLSELTVLLRNATVTIGNVVYPLVDYVSSVSVTPTDGYVPSASTTNVFSVASGTWTGNVETITTTSAHGISLGVGETLYLKVSGTADSNYVTSGLVACTNASGSTFAFAKTGSGTALSTPGGTVTTVAKKLANGDIEMLDVAPLVESDTHTIVVT